MSIADDNLDRLIAARAHFDTLVALQREYNGTGRVPRDAIPTLVQLGRVLGVSEQELAVFGVTVIVPAHGAWRIPCARCACEKRVHFHGSAGMGHCGACGLGSCPGFVAPTPTGGDPWGDGRPAFEPPRVTPIGNVRNLLQQVCPPRQDDQ